MHMHICVLVPLYIIYVCLIYIPLYYETHHNKNKEDNPWEAITACSYLDGVPTPDLAVLGTANKGNEQWQPFVKQYLRAEHSLSN